MQHEMQHEIYTYNADRKGFFMTKEELNRLTNETEWALPLIQDIVSNKVNFEQIEELYKYVCSRQLKMVLDEMCISEAKKGNLDNFLDPIIEKAESIL